MELCREIGALYIDTVVEPWPGFYFDNEARARGALQLRAARDRRSPRGARKPGGTTAVSCCGANPGMVSWFVKQALLNLASDTRRSSSTSRRPARTGRGLTQTRSASRASTSPSATPSAPSSRSRCDVFVNTWSVEGFLSEGMQPAELGWGTHEKMDAGERPQAQDRLPGRDLSDCSPAPTRACAPGRPTPRRNTASWSPTTSRSRSPTISRCARAARSIYRPTCHYAYHPCNDAVLSLHEMFGQAGETQDEHPHPRRERDRRRHRRARRAALRPREERLLVRLAALDRGDARARALPERDRPAGDLGGARRHGLGAGESRRPASSRPTRWISAAASKCRCPISAR